MSATTTTAKADGPPEGSTIRCKPKHRALKKSEPGNLRRAGDLRSRCPGWASEEVQECLLADALVDPESGTDCHGRPRLLWNAVNNVVFIGVSSNEQVPAYNCYPEVPATSLAGQLEARSRRSLDDLLEEGE